MLVSVESFHGMKKAITTPGRRSIGDIEFSPDGSRLAFTVTDPPEVRQLTFSGRSDEAPQPYRLSLRGGDAEKLTNRKALKQVKTPRSLLRGEDDVTDPIGLSQQFYRGLERHHVDADLVLYPREGHDLREQKHLLDRLNRIVAWYDKYVKPDQPATAQ